MPKVENMRSNDGLETRNLAASSGTTTRLLFTRKRLMNLEFRDMYEHSMASENPWEYQQAMVRIFGPVRKLIPFNQSPFHGKCLFETLCKPFAIQCVALS